ncbi:MAG: serine hydrolase, partial [Candidatus Aminicenantes bacterium]
MFRKLIVLVLLSISAGPSFAQSANHKKLDAMIVQGMKDWQIPGLAAVVVKDGEIVFQKTYGVKNLETKLPVD